MLVFLITSVNAQNLSNQYNVVGSIRDSATKKPVAYASISIFDTLQNDMGSTYSLENGLFKIILSEPGSYRLEISVVGYRTSEFSIDIIKDALTVKLGDILVVQEHVSLEEVRVTARKRLVEQKPGMLVYNAESDITNKGGTAADVLRKAPILNVDAQGNVSMRGSSNLKILINGKYSGQMARSAADALNMMPAGLIQSVEIITNPSAKYDAEGAAGVINIITKKGKKDISGTLEASASNLEQMFNPRLSFAKEKWNVNIAGHLHRLRRKSGELQERTSFSGDTATSNLRQLIAKDNTAPHGSADISVDYKINEMSELSLGVNTWFGHWPEDSRMNSAVRSGGIITEQYLQNIASSNSYLGADINIGYNRRFKRPGRQITLLAQGSPSRTISKYDAVKNATDQVLLYRELNYSTTKNKEWTFQADYVQPVNVKGTVHLESGIKIILRNVGNQYNVSASEPNQPDKMIPQDDRSDNFRY
ncbi:MAG: outer membrane beta-barrel protein, partial [Chitinophagaceae bacterium]